MSHDIIADKSCCNICVCIIFFPSKHCWDTYANERNQGSKARYIFSNLNFFSKYSMPQQKLRITMLAALAAIFSD